VQMLWANSNEQWSGCNSRSPCTDRSFAQAKLEPGNGMAWLPVLGELERVKDAAGFDEVLEKIAAADRFDDHYVDFVEAYIEVFSRSAPRDHALVSAVAVAAAMDANWIALVRTCNH